MRQETSNREIREPGIGPLAVATLAAAAALMVAAPASARNDFQNGFEDQLGRIAAHAAVDVGLGILHGGYYPVVPVPQPVYYGPAYASYYDGYGYGNHYYGPRKVVVKYPKHYRHKHHYRGHDRHYRGHDRHYRSYDDRGSRHFKHRKHHGKRHDRHYGKRGGDRYERYRGDDRDHRSRGGRHDDRRRGNW